MGNFKRIFTLAPFRRLFDAFRRIAPKADIIKVRSEIKAMLMEGLAYTTPNLDAAITAARRTRK